MGKIDKGFTGDPFLTLYSVSVLAGECHLGPGAFKGWIALGMACKKERILRLTFLHEGS